MVNNGSKPDAGDEGKISIGNNSNLQDGTLVKAGSTKLGSPSATGTTVGNNVTIGHNATLRACTIADASLIGMDATILEGAQVHCVCCPRKHSKPHLVQCML